MNAPEQTQGPAPLSLVHYLTAVSLPADAACDLDQIDALGDLGPERRGHALEVLAAGFQKHYSNDMRIRLITMMRDLRTKGRHAGARFLLDLFGKLDYNKSLVARELALQAGAEGQSLRAIEIWTDNLVRYNDALGITHVAHQVPKITKLPPEEYQPVLKNFLDKLVRAAPLVASSEGAYNDMQPRLERLNKVLTKYKFAEEAHTVGKVVVDMKLKWGLSF